MTSRALEQFLASVEKRAFKIAQLGLRNDDDALDAVQDAMMKLVQSYGVAQQRRVAAAVLSHPRESHSRPAAAPHGARTHHGLAAGARRTRTTRTSIPIAQAPSPEPTPVRRLELDEAIGVLEMAIARAAATPAAGVPAAEFRRARRQRNGERHGLFGRQREDALFPRAGDAARAAGRSGLRLWTWNRRISKNVRARCSRRAPRGSTAARLSRLTQARHAALDRLQRPVRRAGGPSFRPARRRPWPCWRS